MQKRLLVAIAVLLCLVPLAGAVPPTGSVVYGQSEGIVRSTSLPAENVHIQAQQQETIAATQRLVDVERGLTGVQEQVSSLKVSSETQRSEMAAQLGNINRELGAIKANVDSIQILQQQVSEIRPTLEQPREIIPPLSLVALSVANGILLIVVIVLIFWLRAEWRAKEKESHVEEHAQIHLTDFIREAMHKGASVTEIRRRLLERGWNEGRVDEALQEVRTMHAA
jgi:hypothetical protein